MRRVRFSGRLFSAGRFIVRELRCANRSDRSVRAVSALTPPRLRRDTKRQNPHCVRPLRQRAGTPAGDGAPGAVPAQGLRGELLGQRAARRLMRRFGGQRIRVPHDDSARHRRNVRVIEALQTGSYAAVARRFHLSTRTLVRLGKRVSV